MTNTEMLKDRIAKSGLKMCFISEALGLSREGFRKKLNNTNEFCASEIVALCDLLKLNTSDRTAIFFAK